MIGHMVLLEYAHRCWSTTDSGNRSEHLHKYRGIGVGQKGGSGPQQQWKLSNSQVDCPKIFVSESKN